MWKEKGSCGVGLLPAGVGWWGVRAWQAGLSHESVLCKPHFFPFLCVKGAQSQTRTRWVFWDTSLPFSQSANLSIEVIISCPRNLLPNLLAYLAGDRGSLGSVTVKVGWVGCGEPSHIPRFIPSPLGVSPSPKVDIWADTGLCHLRVEGRVRRKGSNNGQAAFQYLWARLAAGHCHQKASHCRSSRSSLMRIQNPSSWVRDGDTTLPMRASTGWWVWPRKATSESRFRDEQEKSSCQTPPRELPRVPFRVYVQLSTSGSDLEPLCQLSPELAGEPRPTGKNLALSIGYIFKFKIFKYYEAEK